MGECVLEVKIFPFEPLTKGRTRKYERKRAIKKEIEARIGSEQLSRLKAARKGRLFSLWVDFYLWKGSADHSNTRSRKDLDNLLKNVFDTFQPYFDAQQKEEGLGLIEQDAYICEIHATKRLVDDNKDEGLHIRLSEHEDVEMLNLLDGS